MYNVFLFISKSACCTRVCHCHALVSITPNEFPVPGNETMNTDSSSEKEEVLPVTSYACKWKVPCKHKDSTMQMADAVFHKHVYGRERKRTLKPLEDFDPRPMEYRVTANDRLPELLDKLCGKGLCVSLTLDSQTRCWSKGEIEILKPLPLQLPTKQELQGRVSEFKRA